MFGFNENNIANSYFINIYSNSAQGIFTNDLPENTSHATISVLDIYDQLVEEFKIENKSRVQINLYNVARGTCMIKVMIDSNVYRGKLVI